MEEKSLRTAWMALNPRKHPTLSKDALLDAIYFLGLNPSLKRFGELIDEIGEIQFTFDHFKSIAKKITPTTSDEMLDAFRAIDVNKDGLLSRAELVQSLLNFGEKLTEGEVLDVLEFDVDNSGAMDYQEFCNMCFEIQEQMHEMVPPEDISLAEAAEEQQKIKMEKEEQEENESRGKHDDDASERNKASDVLEVNNVPTKSTAGTVGKHSFLNTRIPKPSELKSWHKHALRLRMPVNVTPIPSTQIIHFTIKQTTTFFLTVKATPSALSPSRKPKGEIQCFLAKKHMGSYKVVQSSQPHKNVFCILKEAIETGDYVVVCVSVDALNKRKINRGKLVELIDDGTLQEKGITALEETFQSLDCLQKGSLNQEEYSAHMVQTDGEKCDEDVWDYIIENFPSRNKELTKEGFVACYNQLFDEETTNTDAYEHFEGLGYNRQMVLDECLLLALNIYEKDEESITNLDVSSYDETMVDIMMKQ
eukprot:m.61547 g.61547  ORF g.61547 m.61547 type:complete len:477 (-) comp11395_c2_seq1:2199-3629(-)